MLRKKHYIPVKVYAQNTEQKDSSLIIYSQVYLSGDIVNTIKDNYQINEAELKTFRNELKKAAHALLTPMVLFLTMIQLFVYIIIINKNLDAIQAFTEKFMHWLMV